MKSSLIVLSFLLFAVNVYCHGPKREKTPEEKQAYEECRNELGLPDEKPEGRPDFKDPKMRCLPACLSKKSGKIVNGKIVPEVYIAHFKKRHPDADESKITSCIEKANQETDECQVALVAMKCLKEAFGHSKHHGH